ncbi:dipeptidase [Alteromonas sp. CYL-A6]|uniref:dipeptidase n=1 Tax=Alteromonas nitratireducens TaxID=3390813 RepID=UPI0034C1892C
MPSLSRREFLTLTATALAGSALPLSWGGSAARSAQAVYQGTHVIDALSFAREWNDASLDALSKTGYSGIITSLPRRDLQTAIDALMSFRQLTEAHPDKLRLALTANDFEEAKANSQVAVMMNFQNATMLEGNVDNVDALHALGTRCFQLTYNSRNLLGDGCTERTDAGLSDFGVEVVARMNETGVLIDLSHCGKQTTADGIALSGKPVAITHTMTTRYRPGHPRAKDDITLKTLADNGGVAGIAAIGYFVGDDPGGETTIETYADHIEHAVRVAGIEHVGVATDFPVNGIASWATKENWYEPRLRSFKPSYDVKWPSWIPELDGPDRFLNLTHVLQRRGWPDGHIEKLLGGNWLRLFADVFGG